MIENLSRLDILCGHPHTPMQYEEHETDQIILNNVRGVLSWIDMLKDEINDFEKEMIESKKYFDPDFYSRTIECIHESGSSLNMIQLWVAGIKRDFEVKK